MTFLTLRALQQDVEALFSPGRSPTRPGAVGAEVELIAVTDESEPRPVALFDEVDGAPSLAGFLTAWAASTELLAEEWDDLGNVRFRTFRGGVVTFEPGGQVEYSTLPCSTAAAALSDVRAVLDPLREAALEQGIALVAKGLNPWHGLGDIDLQIESPRYAAMDRYFAHTGSYGQRMMRLTAAMQVNLDLGDPATARSRWRIANLLSPVLRAVFANSPAVVDGIGPVAGGRSVLWDMADPGRTGVAGWTGVDSGVSPWEDYLAFALSAPVMLKRDHGGNLRAAEEGLRFEEWLGAADGPPSAEEWRVHLTTLFPDVRPRGWLEVRCVDVPAEAWWGVPLTLLPALLYDDEALHSLESVLRPLAADLPEHVRSAARGGLASGLVADLAPLVFEVALDAVRRSPPGYFDDSMVEATEEFRRRYVLRRCTQADEEGIPRARF